MFLGKKIISSVSGIEQNLDDSRSNAGPTPSTSHTWENFEIRIAAKAQNVARVETGIGILSREMGIG